MKVAPQTSIERLLDDYDRFLLDAYGVLVDDQGPLPGAIEFIAELQRRDKPFLILTNSASRLPEGIASSLQELGFSLDLEHILSSGMLLPGFFAEHGLIDAPCLVLGTQESSAYVTRAGGRVLPLNESAAAEVLVIADQAGFDCLEVMDQALSLIMQRFDSGQALALVLCNPDLIYPRGAGRFGFTAGALAAMLEALIEERYAALNAGFVRLGKPYEPIFREALHRTGKGRAVMFGDQLATDILGAQRAGIDSVWVRTGLGSGNSDQTAVPPTWQLSNLVCDRQVTDG